MPTPHNEANTKDISKTVIMPGDPLRAKYIAESFLDNYKLVNSVRGIFAYTGTYKGKELTVMASGMGMPSMGIYSYELYKFYNVETIIRIGSCGGYDPSLKLFDIVLSDKCYSESNFALTYNNENCHLVEASNSINSVITTTAHEIGTKITKGTTLCTDCFDLYMTDSAQLFNRIPEGIKITAAEMEAFSLFYIAKSFKKNASCIMSVVDLNFDKNAPRATAEERETGLNKMILLALESAIKL